MKINTEIINKSVHSLLKGEDHRGYVISYISSIFSEEMLKIFKKVIRLKIEGKILDKDWYYSNFIKGGTLDEKLMFSGLNKKTITNIYGSARKEIILEATEENFWKLSESIKKLLDDEDVNIKLTIKLKDVSVDLGVNETFLFINALAVKRHQISGGAWSSIGKQVENKLMIALLESSGVKEDKWDNKFKKDSDKSFDREVDFYVLTKDDKKLNIEVKLMGKGNPESADAIFARGTHIFIADTLSEMNKNQLKDSGVQFIYLKNNKNILSDFKKVLKTLNVI